MKKNVATRFFSGIVKSRSDASVRQSWEKNDLTSPNCSDNQHVNRFYLSMIPNAVPRF
jgi:hypothetical protein